MTHVAADCDPNKRQPRARVHRAGVQFNTKTMSRRDCPRDGS